MFVEDSVDSRPFVHQFARKFLLNYYSFSFKSKKYASVNSVLIFISLFTIIQSILAVTRGPQCCLPFAFLSALPSWLLFPPSLFQFPGIRLIADFIATMSFTHGFFKFTRDKFPAKFFHDNLLITHDTRKLVTSFPVKLNLKNKNKRNNKTIVSLDESNLSKGQFFALLVPYLLTFAILIVAVCRTLVIYELRNGPCPPKSLWGSVVKHRSAESENLRFDFSWRLEISLASSKP